MTFEEIVLQSRFNQYYWIYPAVICLGLGLIIFVSFIKQDIVRRILKTGIVFVFSYAAMIASSMAIQEKWAIRHYWSQKNENIVTTEQSRYLSADGANLLLGPVIYGFIAFVTFSMFCGLLYFCFKTQSLQRFRPKTEKCRDSKE